jgi:hypothetical protein
MLRAAHHIEALLIHSSGTASMIPGYSITYNTVVAGSDFQSNHPEQHITYSLPVKLLPTPGLMAEGHSFFAFV